MSPMQNRKADQCKNVQILVVDDEPGMRDLLFYELKNKGYQVSTASNGIEALDLVKKQKFDVIISDVKMPRMSGIALLEEVKLIAPDTEMIMTTGYGNVETAVEAMKKGAYDFVLKPFNLEEIYLLIEKALEKSGLKMLAALHEAGNFVFSQIRKDELAREIIKLVAKLIHAEESHLFMMDSNRELKVAASSVLGDSAAKRTHLKIAENFAAYAIREKKDLLLLNGLRDYPQFSSLASENAIYSAVVCPLFSEEETLGALVITQTERKINFTHSDFECASIFASQAALAINNAALYAELENKIRELESAQSQLLQSEKLASMGRLVSGVAHELNNPLTAVIGYTQLILEDGVQGDMKRQLNIVFQQAQRCRQIVQNLLSFARKQKPQPKALNVDRLIDETIDGLNLEMEKNEIKIIKEYGKTPEIQGDENQLKQVFINILNNAIQALHEKAGGKEIWVHIRFDADEIMILFKDNGPGIAKENLSKIFDPFFTTKEVGKGTGLGLSLSYGIIREHGGTITAESQPGCGASFIVHLPRNVLPQAAPAPAVSFPGIGIRKNILMIEDEESVRDLIGLILGKEYDIDTAADGEEGLDKLKSRNYDLVLCDYMIPKINGMMLYERIKKIKPNLAARFMFVSGSTEFIQNGTEFFKRNNLHCLLKPFTKKELFGAIEEVFARQ